MTFAERYSERLWPDRAVVLGVRLERLTIRRGLLLERVRPGLAGREGNPLEWSRADLVLFLWVMGQRDGKGAAGRLQRRRTGWWLRWWEWQLRAGEAMWGEGFLWAAKARIADWLEGEWNGPETWQEELTGEEKWCHAPLLQLLKVRLMGWLGCSAEEALDYGVSEAQWDLAAWAEDQGRLVLVSEKDAAMIGSLTGAC